MIPMPSFVNVDHEPRLTLEWYMERPSIITYIYVFLARTATKLLDVGSKWGLA